MKKSDLCEQLQKIYTPGAPGGVAKIKQEGLENIWFVIPAPLPTANPKKLPTSLLAQANRLLQSLGPFNKMNETDRLINYLYVRREAVQSSRMEGTYSTIDHVLTPGDIADSQEKNSSHVSVRGYAHALETRFEEAFKKRESIFTLETITNIHKDIINKDPNSKAVPGRLRAPGQAGSIVHIGGGIRIEDSIYNPTPPAYVKEELLKVIDWFQDQEMAEKGDAGVGLGLILRMSIGHAHFEAVHPFEDGNGRVGRALWPLQMICSGHMPLYLSGFVEKEKDDYAKALQKAQKRLEYGPIIEFLCQAIINSHTEAQISRDALLSLPELWLQRGKFRQNSTAQQALNLLLHRPILSVETLMQELNVSRPAATNALNQLVERNIVRIRGKENRSRLFAAEELISILSRDFGTDVELAIEHGQRLLQYQASGR